MLHTINAQAITKEKNARQKQLTSQWSRENIPNLIKAVSALAWDDTTGNISLGGYNWKQSALQVPPF